MYKRQVLTSGAAANCLAGRETIGKLLALRDEIGGPEILIGAGVNASVITELRRDFPAARAFHMSGKTEVESAMQFRRQDVPMGLPGLDEWHLQYTSEEYVRAARLALDLSLIHISSTVFRVKGPDFPTANLSGCHFLFSPGLKHTDCVVFSVMMGWIFFSPRVSYG